MVGKVIEDFLFFSAYHEDDFSFLWGGWSQTGIAFLIIRKNKAIKFKFYVPRIQDGKNIERSSICDLAG